MTHPPLSDRALRALIASQFDNVLVDAAFADLPRYSRGKVRDSYDVSRTRRIIVTTDRQSAFDQVLAAVPFKGQVLNETARFWFEATADIVANHVVAFPDPNITVARRVNILPVEVVVRDYLTGSTSTSIWPMYRDGHRTLYGVTLPDGLKKNCALPQTIVTPTTKAPAGGHDAPVTPTEIVEHGLLTADRWAEIVAISLAVFERGRTIAAANGLILVDTKYEFGVDEDGRLVLADEVHTPDSSRYWRATSYPGHLDAGTEPDSLDKEFLRLWIAERCDPYREPIPQIPRETLIDFAARYVRLYEAITGLAFRPAFPDETIRERVRAAISSYLAAG